jgi:hypothetical protein
LLALILPEYGAQGGLEPVPGASRPLPLVRHPVNPVLQLARCDGFGNPIAERLHSKIRRLSEILRGAVMLLSEVNRVSHQLEKLDAATRGVGKQHAQPDRRRALFIDVNRCCIGSHFGRDSLPVLIGVANPPDVRYAIQLSQLLHDPKWNAVPV